MGTDRGGFQWDQSLLRGRGSLRPNGGSGHLRLALAGALPLVPARPGNAPRHPRIRLGVSAHFTLQRRKERLRSPAPTQTHEGMSMSPLSQLPADEVVFAGDYRVRCEALKGRCTTLLDIVNGTLDEVANFRFFAQHARPAPE